QRHEGDAAGVRLGDGPVRDLRRLRGGAGAARPRRRRGDRRARPQRGRAHETPRGCRGHPREVRRPRVALGRTIAWMWRFLNLTRVHTTNLFTNRSPYDPPLTTKLELTA